MVLVDRIRNMIKLFSLKEQKKEGEGAKVGVKRASAAMLRIQKGAAWFCVEPQRNNLLCCHYIIDLFRFIFLDLLSS